MSNFLQPPWTVALQTPLSMKFSWYESGSGLPSPPPRDLPDAGIEPASPALETDSSPLSYMGSSFIIMYALYISVFIALEAKVEKV